jgi:hypothetical protein
MTQKFKASHGYNDLLGATTTAKIPAVNAPSWTTYDFGIGGGIAFQVLGFGPGEYIDIYYQLHHGVELSTVVENHIHWTIPTNDAGKRHQWQIDVIAAAIGSAFAVPTGSPFTSEYTLGGAESAKHNYFEVGNIPAFNTTVSSIAIVRLQRIAATTAEYGSDVYVLFNDCHVQLDTVSSLTETVK